jgi:hypothetical protein
MQHLEQLSKIWYVFVQQPDKPCTCADLTSTQPQDTAFIADTLEKEYTLTSH